MRKMAYILWMVLLSVACVRESGWRCDFSSRFEMQDVPYVLEGSEVVEYRPYYWFTNTLELLAFADQKLISVTHYDYEFCKNNRVIPFQLGELPDAFLFVSNLYDQKAMKYSFKEGRLAIDFSILDHQEPPTYLMAVQYPDPSIDPLADPLVSVDLKMLVARLEVEVLNPSSWIDSVQIVILDIAETVSDDFALSDTTYIVKQAALFPAGEFLGWLGVNTFASYPGHPSRLSISFIGGEQRSTYIITNELLNFKPHTITSLRIEFDDAGGVVVSISVDGKWEVVDEGNIEI